MKRLHLLPSIACLLGLALSASAQTTWTGAIDNDWNNAGNWDAGVPAEGVPAIIGVGNTVNYNAPMAATSFGGLNNTATLTVSSTGFTIDPIGAAAYVGNASSLLRVVGGGVVLATNTGTITLNTGSDVVIDGGSLIITNTTGTFAAGLNANNNGIGFTNNGGTVVLDQSFQSRGRFTRVMMSGGTTDLRGGSGIYESSNDQERPWVVNGGTVNLGDFLINRTLHSVGSAGLVLSNGVVNATSMRIGVGASRASSTIYGGVLTNAGLFYINDRVNAATSSERRVFFYIRGGSVYSSVAEGIIVGNQSNAGAASSTVMGGFLDINSGLLVAEGITLVRDTSLQNVHGTFTLSGSGEVYLGGVGLNGNVGVSGTTYTITQSGGTLGAKANYAINANMTLSGTTAIIKAADISNNPFNITHNGNLTGNGVLNKTGGGTLTLNGINTYSGNTFINDGTLALGAGAALANTPQIIIASGATFDVSAVAGYTLAATRTLGGLGTVVGDVAVASGGLLSPGTSPGTLTLANSLTFTGGGGIHFELPTTPGPGNDRLIVNGDLNTSGMNTIEIVGGGSAGAVHALIQYGGNFNGTVGDFSLTGVSGILSNNASLKTIYLVVQSTVRSPGNVVWVGNPVVNDWDTVNRTNWVNTGTSLLDYFVTGDNARFDATGAANPIVNLVGNNAPATVTVDATANYTFGGSGAISGSATLLKTNSGTLTVTAANTYTGPTIIGGGVLEATTLANAGNPSGIGAAAADPANLTFAGGTLRYPGASVSTDRGASFMAEGGTIQVSDIGTVLTANGTLTGSGALTKTGPGVLTLNAGNSHGGTVITAGTVRLNAANAGGAAGVTNHGATLVLAGPSVSGTISHPNTMHFTGVSTVDLNNYAGNSVLDGAWSGDGTVNIINQESAARVFTVGGNGAGGGHLWNFSGTINMGDCPGDLRFNDGGGTGSGPNFGSSNAVFNLGNSTARLLVRNGGTTTHLGELRGGASTRLSGRGSSAGIATYRIGGRNTDATFEGSIVDTDTATAQLTAIVKVGSGRWTLTGNSTHTSTTTIESGILQVDGALGNTPVTVLGGTLAGGGSIDGTVDVQSEGTLSPGASLGTLTINNTLTLGGNTVIEVNKGVGNDQVIVNGTVSYGGKLTANNVGGPLNLGDNFPVFTASSPSGDFWEVQGSPGPGLAWAFDPNTGLLSVVAGAPVLNVERVGNNLVFSWTGENLKLQAQTNSVSVGLSNNWGDYPGGSTSGVSVPINFANGTVFFRLTSSQ